MGQAAFALVALPVAVLIFRLGLDHARRRGSLSAPDREPGGVHTTRAELSFRQDGRSCRISSGAVVAAANLRVDAVTVEVVAALRDRGSSPFS